MAYLNQRLGDTYDTGYVSGELGGQNGYTENIVTGAAAVVDLTSQIDGTGSVSFTSPGTTQNAVICQKSFSNVRANAATLASGTPPAAVLEDWLITYRAKVLATATAGHNFYVVLQASGNGSLFVAVQRNSTTGVVDMQIQDNVNPIGGGSFTTISNVAALGAKFGIRVRLLGATGYTVEVDRTGNQNWVGVATGTLVAGNEAVDSFYYGTLGTVFVSSTVFFDTLYAFAIGSQTIVTFNPRPNRGIKVVSAAYVNGDPNTRLVQLKLQIFETSTGQNSSGNSTRFRNIADTMFDVRNGKITDALCRELMEELTFYDLEQQVAVFSSSGHENYA